MEWRSRERRTWTSRLTGASAGGAVAVALLMALSAAASAAVVKAPYSKAISSTFQYTDASGCATAAFTSPANWSSTTGTFTAGEKASAKSCAKSLAGVGASSYGSASMELEVAIPIHINTSTTHSLQVNWKIHATVAKTFTPGVCTAPKANVSYWYCDSFVEQFLEGDSYLVDTTNNTYTYGTFWDMYNESYNETFYSSGTESNYSGSPSYGHTGNVTFFINTSTLNRADSYALVTYIYISSYADLYSYQATLTGASGSSSIALFGGANKAVLASIVVT